jgi:hypothetical protein
MRLSRGFLGQPFLGLVNRGLSMKGRFSVRLIITTLKSPLKRTDSLKETATQPYNGWSRDPSGKPSEDGSNRNEIVIR